ncbi:MAG: hypothetical protein ABGX27_06270 [Desulfurobacteriaceae bacterium]
MFGFLMVTFGIWHLVLNWKSFVSYLKDKARRTLSKEFLFTTLITIFVFIEQLRTSNLLKQL